MSDIYETLDEATAALASTAERAAILIRTESARAKEEASRTRSEIDDIRREIRGAKAEFEVVRNALSRQDGEKDRIRRSAGWAWSAVGLMAACVTIAVGWTAMQLTHGRDVVGGLNNEVSQLRQTVGARDAELSSLRELLNQARLAELRARVTMEIFAQADDTEAFDPAAADEAASANWTNDEPQTHVVQPVQAAQPVEPIPAPDFVGAVEPVLGNVIVTNQ